MKDEHQYVTDLSPIWHEMNRKEEEAAVLQREALLKGAFVPRDRNGDVLGGTA